VGRCEPAGLPQLRDRASMGHRISIPLLAAHAPLAPEGQPTPLCCGGSASAAAAAAVMRQPPFARVQSRLRRCRADALTPWQYTYVSYQGETRGILGMYYSCVQ
jgi:hypothetical protein